MTVRDARGYVGSERNRELSPEQVVWARQASFEQGHSAREIRAALAAQGVEMSIDSVRRMLRGDTYANVGVQVPRVPLTAPAAAPAASLVPLTTDDVQASAERLAAAIQATQATTPDALVAEVLSGRNPFEKERSDET